MIQHAASTKTLLVADIGGTHSRFALFSLDVAARDPAESLTFVRSARFLTQDALNSGDLMRLLAETPGDDGGFFLPSSPRGSLPGPARVDAAVFAIPGPTSVADPSLPPARDEVCYCPNIAWPFEAAVISASLGGVPVRFINDFVANGFACALLPALMDAVPVLPGDARPEFPRAVVGGGTGLGHCLILPGEKPAVLGSESGHTIFPFIGEEEGIARYFRKTLGTDRPDGDDVVAGTGLATLYAYYTGEKLHPCEVPARVAAHPEALAVMARFYGRAIGHYVLSTLALGGVFVTGGLAANLPVLLEHPEFSAELRERTLMRRILAPVPVWHVRNQDAGLWGAAAYASLMV